MLLHLPLLLLLLLAPTQDLDPNHQWGHWRGPRGTGEAPHADPPVEWSEDENVRWKVAVPGRGHSSPIVWGGRVFVTTAVPADEALEEPVASQMPGAHDNAPVTHAQRFVVRAHSRMTGELVWERTVREAVPHDTAHATGGFASPSPVTDGERLFASFGSAGLFALDPDDGELLWSRDLGDMDVKHSHGEGAGPALHGHTVVVNWDHEGDSFVVALDAGTGEELWRSPREEPTSWATPIIVPVGEAKQVIVPGTERLRAYDLASGEVVWECGGLSHNVVASPVHARGIVVAGSSYEKNTMLAVRLDGARGDLTDGEDERLLWFRRRRAPYVPSPLVVGDVVYNLQHYQPVLCRTELESGEQGERPLRLRELRNLYASPVAAAGRVYLTDLEGTTLVLEHAPVDERPRALAVNRLEDSFSASPALVDDVLILRGERFLYCIVEDDS